MIVGANINSLVQQVMAMRTPEVAVFLPEVEAMSREDRIALVERGHRTTDTLIKNWDKMADIFAARGEKKNEIKRRGRDLKEVRKNLDRALRLMDPKVIPVPYRDNAEGCFNVLAAWFKAHQNDLAAIYSLPVVRRQDISTVVAAALDSSAVHSEAAVVAGADMVDREILVDGPANARSIDDGELEDVLDVSRNSTVH